MQVIARKTKQKLFFLLHLIVGIVIMGASVIGLPIAVYIMDASLFTYGFAVLVILAIMLIFGLIGYFSSLRPFLIYRKLPEVQAETDGEYLYIHGKKEAKIPLDKLGGMEVQEDLQYVKSWEFLVHLMSEKHANVHIKIPKYGKFKLYFVAHATDVALTLIGLAEDAKRKK